MLARASAAGADHEGDCDVLLRVASELHPSGLEAVRPVVEKLGGRVINGWFSFGEYDVLLVCEMPDAISAAALSMAISSSGAVKAVKTTPLMTFDEGVAALKKANSAEYAAPPTEIPYFGTYRPTV